MAAVGFLLFLTPFAFGSISNTDPAAWTAAATTAWVGGLLLLLFSAESVFTVFDRWIELLPLIEGILLFVAPWVLGFTSIVAMAWIAWAAGILTLAISGSALLDGRANRRSARA
jgi:hypothetical protein